jgi:hypothetical protein
MKNVVNVYHARLCFARSVPMLGDSTVTRLSARESLGLGLNKKRIADKWKSVNWEAAILTLPPLVLGRGRSVEADGQAAWDHKTTRTPSRRFMQRLTSASIG